MDLRLLIIAPVLLGLLVLLAFGWRHEMKRRRQKKVEEARGKQKEALANGGIVFRPLADRRRRSKGRGQIAMLVDGSYGLGVLPYILKAFQQIGAEGHVGLILVVELDLDHQEMALAEIPDVFHDRVIFTHCPHFSVGLSGDRIDEVWGYREKWRTSVEEHTKTWLHRMQRETEPGLLFTLLSPGGSAALARPPIEAFRQRYPDYPVYAATILDDKSVVRERFPQMRQFYGGLVRGWIISDNRRHLRQTDLGLSVLFAGMVGATWIGQRPLDIWNGAAYMYPKEQTRVATLSVWGEMLPVYHVPGFEDAVDPLWYTSGPTFEEKARRGIKTVTEHPELQSLPLEPAPKGVTRITCVVAPIVPPDLERCATNVDESLAEWREYDPDLSIQYASTSMPLTPESTEAPMIVVELQPIAGGLDEVEKLALGAPVDAKFLPEPVVVPRAALPAKANGHDKEATDTVMETREVAQ